MRVSPRRAAAALAALAALVPPVAAGAPAPGEWDLRGDVLLKADYFDNDGNRAVSPFRFEDGQFQGTWNLTMTRRRSPYDRQELQLLGRVNASDYVRDYRGAGLDRMTFRWENGEAKTPFRLTLGDHFAFVTPRTMRRALKGFALELQPRSALDQSVYLFSGAVQPSFRNLALNQEQHHGISWLARPDERGTVSLNLVASHRRGAGARAELDQLISSVALARRLATGRHRLSFEGEAAAFEGDHDAEPAGSRGEKAGRGYFYRLDGASDRWTYALRREDFDGDYRPLGAGVLPDQRSDTYRAAYRFASGWRVEGRVLDLTSGRTGATPLERVTRGLRVSGALRIGGRRGQAVADFFRVRSRAAGLATDAESRVYNASYSTRVGPWATALGFLDQEDDDLAAGRVAKTRQVTLNGSRPVRMGRWAGSFRAGVQHRASRGPGGQNNLGGNLGLDLARGARFLQASVRHFYQDQFTVPGSDVLTRDYQVRVGRRAGDRQLALELGYQTRLSDQVASNHAFRVGVVYGVGFGSRGPRSLSAGAAAPDPGVAPPGAAAPTPGAADELDLAAFVPGSKALVAAAIAAGYGYAASAPEPWGRVYEDRFFRRFSERQRLYFVDRAGALARAGVVFDIGGAGTGDDLETLYQRVRDYLIQRYGTPDLSFDEGDLGPGLADRIRSGDTRRITQWRTPFGALRFGIPRRLDGLIRLELVHAADLPPPTQPDWSFEPFR